jgi:putative ABC transport system permease protein
MRGQDKGLAMEQMLIVNGPSVLEREGSRQRLISLKNELKGIPSVLGVTTSGAIPGGGYNWGTGIRRDGTQPEESKSGSIVWVDPDFVETYGISILSGRAFNPEIKSDMESVLINEAAIVAFGLKDPENALKERLLLGGDTTAIIGVLKNYHWNSLKTEHTPFLFKADTISQRNYSIHLSGNNINETIKLVEQKYRAKRFRGIPLIIISLMISSTSNTGVSNSLQEFLGCLPCLLSLLPVLDYGDWHPSRPRKNSKKSVSAK